jgi:hypothetical protein
MEPATPAEPGRTAVNADHSGTSVSLPDSRRAVSSAEALVVIESQLRECFARAAYSHKTHEKCADIALGRLGHIKVWQLLLSAVTTGGLLAVAFGPADKSKVTAAIAAVVSTALLALNAYTKENDLGQTAQKHKETADKLWNVRESYLSLLTDVRAGFVQLDDVRKRRDELQMLLSATYESAPRTSGKGYALAQDALKAREDLTFSDAEIDQFLPVVLRRTVTS